MKRVCTTVVCIGAAAMLLVSGCDSGGGDETESGGQSGSEGPESCRSIVEHMQEISDEAPDKEKGKMVIDMTVKACEKTNSLEKHSETLTCVSKASSQKEMDDCEGYAEMEKEWQQSIKNQMSGKVQDMMKKEMESN